MKIFIFLFTIVFSTNNCFSIDCGNYYISGIARKIGFQAYVLVNEKTASEIKLLIELKETPKIVPYINSPISLEALIKGKANGTLATISDLKKITRRVPSPLAIPPDSGMSLLSTTSCK